MEKSFLIIFGEKNQFENQIQIFQACRSLTGSGFKLYIYLNTFVNEEDLFSPRACQQDTGLSISSIHRAFKELIDKNYLIKVKERTFEFSRGKKLI